MRTSENKLKTSPNGIDHDEYSLIPIKTDYIKPNESYDIIIENAAEFLQAGDFLVISETPISVSQGRLVDESEFQASILSFLLADLWSKYMWGYILGPIFRIKNENHPKFKKTPTRSPNP